MNPIYSLIESPHRWLIGAATAFVAAFFGVMFMLAYTWPHWLATTWFYLLLAATIFCLIQAFIEWRRRVETELKSTERQGR